MSHEKNVEKGFHPQQGLDDDLFGDLCEFVGEVGLGKDRSQGHGRFDVVGWKALTEAREFVQAG